ncbi:helix-turn-helix transcriptional regulator [Brevibacillus laterosporus]|uniref:Addiction module antidote protein n=1 Tax=Brevibacillus laterosporus LMG 15441 TaxID=1042163 RepID=A0A075R6K0_BRELA|nr:helix-turn-helix domain-containing protein [Brevibacillus laterosporus]AIG27469.1 addiction module antidote protein [Brevibacillus laterosporus LMG 15441]MED1666113.1 helix-turn-helix domain-containing protein [Brevibacillus laterosporus]MED1670332.1 helix-turn-helix domain-containing protein [Brevibacillus laterosporus]MED1717873.1 helix-turn-helix domain-containing protein [Brevibacillus laterosporus]NKQ20630.1 helix-turn-helix domain-containing protein [Brevibacillus laterosporus]
MKNKIRCLRKSEDFNISQEDLAKELGVHRDTITRVENGRNPSGELMLKISHYFNKDAREIFYCE